MAREIEVLKTPSDAQPLSGVSRKFITDKLDCEWIVRIKARKALEANPETGTRRLAGPAYYHVIVRSRHDRPGQGKAILSEALCLTEWYGIDECLRRAAKAAEVDTRNLSAEDRLRETVSQQAAELKAQQATIDRLVTQMEAVVGSKASNESTKQMNTTEAPEKGKGNKAPLKSQT